MLDFVTDFIFKKDLDKITEIYLYSSIRKYVNKIIVDIDSDTDNIYQIKFIKHLNGSITCAMINGWCDFQVDFEKYGYKIRKIVKEFNNKVKEHKKCWLKLSSRGCKIHNCEFQEDIYKEYVLARKYG